MGNSCCVSSPDSTIIELLPVHKSRSERFPSFDAVEEMNGYRNTNGNYINLQFSLKTDYSLKASGVVKYRIQYLFQTLDWIEEVTAPATTIKSKTFGIYLVLFDDDKFKVTISIQPDKASNNVETKFEGMLSLTDLMKNKEKTKKIVLKNIKEEAIESKIIIKEIKERLIEQFNLLLRLEHVSSTAPISYLIYYNQSKSKTIIFKSKPEKQLSGNITYDAIVINCNILDNFTPDTEMIIEFIEEKPNDTDLIFRGSVSMNTLNEAKTDYTPLSIIKRKTFSVQAYAKEDRNEVVLSYFDLLADGVKYVPIIALDLSLANLTFDNNRILHHLNPMKPNIYMNVIDAISKMYSEWSEFSICYGFGAKVVPKKTETSNCFALNGNYFNPVINTLEQLKKAYKESLRKIEITLPVKMKDIIKITNQFAAAEMDSKTLKKYFVLIVICAGVIDDLDDATSECVKMANLPISLIIIKVGNLQSGGADIDSLSKNCKKSLDQRKYFNVVNVDTTSDDLYYKLRDCQSSIPWQSLQFYKQYKGKQRVNLNKSKIDKTMYSVLDEAKASFTQQLIKDGWTEAEIDKLYSNGIEENDLVLARHFKEIQQNNSQPPASLTDSVLLDDKKKEALQNNTQPPTPLVNSVLLDDKKQLN